MDILILGHGTPRISTTYRGTDRTIPHYVEELSEANPVNQLFLWYCEEGGESGLVHDLVKSKELVLTYRELQPPQHFEIIEVSTNSSHQSAGEILGFDLSAGYSFSLLSWGLEIDSLPDPDIVDPAKYKLISPFLRLVKEYFQRKLNMNGLFDDYNTAEFCLECMMALQGIYPGLWENEEVTFKVIGLWKIDV